jgi:hypothetical protein
MQAHYLKQSLWWLQRAARRGYAEAQYQLACLHDLGEHIPKQPYCALKWYKKAVWRGHLPALKRLLSLWFNTSVKRFF